MPRRLGLTVAHPSINRSNGRTCDGIPVHELGVGGHLPQVVQDVQQRLSHTSFYEYIMVSK